MAVERSVCAGCGLAISRSSTGVGYWRSSLDYTRVSDYQFAGICDATLVTALTGEGSTTDHVPVELPADLAPETVEAWLAR